MDVSGIHTRVGGVIVEVDGLWRESNSIPRGIDLIGTNLTLAVRVGILSGHAIASFWCVAFFIFRSDGGKLNKKGGKKWK